MSHDTCNIVIGSLHQLIRKNWILNIILVHSVQH